MTESERTRMSISGLLDVLDTGISLSTCHVEYAIQCDVLEDLVQCLEELEQYRAIGTIERFRELTEKAEPKKAIGKKYIEAYCPTCKEVISDGEFWLLDEYVHHCNKCGQAVMYVDWE